jgi:hypothetical protein
MAPEGLWSWSGRWRCQLLYTCAGEGRGAFESSEYLLKLCDDILGAAAGSLDDRDPLVDDALDDTVLEGGRRGASQSTGGVEFEECGESSGTNRGPGAWGGGF